VPKQTQKGNPASHRMSNASLKARRERSWYSGQRRRQRNREQQRVREIANKARLTAGEPLPWEVACAERHARRLAAGLHAAWLKRHSGA